MKIIEKVCEIIITIIFLPLILLELFIVYIPRERRARKWRKNIKAGDYAYFLGAFNKKQYGRIEKIYENGEVDFRTNVVYHTLNTDLLYPLK